ncbi:hypothetical protein [Mycobacterium sp. 1081908.1]|uniref:hypothetical protein n=1 Tax=Mycobacterium sp. 1081908.1 TaxID=1834066 RepID=UPI0007FC0E0B|nr:hypothetical protein [Mycobacterium sp. 1081908.1]OBK52354.1 hypothetical protein A5655_21755 [Mycobacterium sp. 1081908.1]
MLWCKAGIEIARAGLTNRLMSYSGLAAKENASEFAQRQAQDFLISELTEAVEAIGRHAADAAASLPAGLTETLAKIQQDDAAPSTHFKELRDITTAVKDLLERLESDAPDVPHYG